MPRRERRSSSSPATSRLITPDDVAALVAACSATAPTGVRNRALLLTLYFCGLRLTDALELGPADVDPFFGVVTVGATRSHGERSLQMGRSTAMAVERWIELRASLAPLPGAPLFCTLTGGAMEPSYVRHLLSRLVRKSGIDARVHAHGMRDAYAARLLSEGTSVDEISHRLGHARLSVTRRYLARLQRRIAIDP
ncbi:MAG: tyrosine-type recombinase/integrase [Solirubrobacterales bacterium]|nr:tyrosine-type recombinase/integrase [Solirubrobacterales bacterium]